MTLEQIVFSVIFINFEASLVTDRTTTMVLGRGFFDDIETILVLTDFVG